MKAQDDQARLDRLPKHAREEIILLRNTVESLRAKLRVGPADSNVFLNPYGENPTPLGTNPMLQFKTGERAEDVEGFTVQFVGDELRVQGMAPSHEDYMAVLPMSGNYVAIRHVKKGS